jgi:predicted PurR-regulated permease PerM
MGLLRWGRRQSSVEAEDPRTDVSTRSVFRNHRRRNARFIVGLFFLAAFSVLYVARNFFIPVALALLFALILAPAVRALRRCRLPDAAGAAIVLVAFLGLLALAGYFLAGPLSAWIERGPEMWSRLSARFESITQPIRELKATTERTGVDPAQPAPPAPPIALKQTGLLKTLAAQTGAAVTLAGTAFILLYFLLATGDPLLASIMAAVSNSTHRERVLAISQDIKQRISKYLFTVTLINFSEGVLIAGGVALAGMPTPLLWGALHALLNFIPYLGAITGLAITTLAAFVSFDTLPRQLIPPAIYLGVMVLDNFASPMVLGKRLILNPVLVFVSLMLWGWLWGIAGILIAIPLLLALKIICDHIPDWERYGRILSAGKQDS